MRFLIFVGFIFGLAKGEQIENFHGSRLYSLKIYNSNDPATIHTLQEKYDVWKLPRAVKDEAHVFVTKEKIGEFENFLKNSSIKYKVLNNNVQRSIDNTLTTVVGKSFFGLEWSNYHPLKDIYGWLDIMAETVNDSKINVVVGGRTYEGREVKGIEIINGKNLPGVFLESGIHAREWAAPASTTWMVNEIIKSPKNSPFRKFNYVYFPVFNPDGYVHSWTSNRLWRKTRTPYKKGDRTCYGADPNRNWDFHWNTIGTSRDPCSEIYAGPHAFSEIEMKTLSDYIKKIKKPKNLDIYITYHTYSQLLLYPWGDSKNIAPHKPFWEKVGAAAAKAHKAVHNQTLKYGQGAVILYPTSGASDDWFYGNYNSSIAFTMEMRDTGKHGFLLPPDQIIPNAEEHLAALKAILEEYLKMRRSRKYY